MRVLEGPLIEDSLTVGPVGGRRKVWFVTPTVLSRELTRLPAEVVSFATAHPQMVGGYDLANRRPRSLRRAVPSGTVLFLEDSEVAASWRLLCEDNADDHDHWAGYGVALVGRW